MPLPALTVALLLAGVVPVGLSWAVYRRPSVPGIKPFGALLALVGLWSVVYAASTVAAVPLTHRVLQGCAVSLQILLPGVWLFFALEYTGRSLWLARGCLLLAAGLAMVTVFVVSSDPTTPLLWTEYRIQTVGGAVVAEIRPGSWLLVALAAGAAFLAAGLVWLLGTVTTDPRQYGVQGGLLALAAVGPAGATAGWYLGLVPIDGSSLVVTGLVPLLWVGVRRWSLLGSTPATRRVGQATAIDDLGDAVLVLDERRQVVDLNERARELFGPRDVEPIGTPIDGLFEAPVPLDGTGATLTLGTDRGYREFRASTSAVEGARGEEIGHTLVLHDTTDESQRRQRFEVLNRVLRHNIRNTMNAVMGYASRLETEVGDDAVWMLERIQRQTSAVAELGERAGTIDRITAPDEDPTEVDVATVLDAIGERLADRDGVCVGVDVDVDVPDGLAVRTNRAVLEEAVRNAGYSLLASDGADPTRLRLTATAAADGWVDVAVTSDGDPVPAFERAVIDRGEETQLSHSRDLDLWLVAWSVETLGGRLSFSDGDNPGIELRIPDLPDAPG